MALDKDHGIAQCQSKRSFEMIDFLNVQGQRTKRHIGIPFPRTNHLLDGSTERHAMSK